MTRYITIFFLCLISTTTALANQVPEIISYQGTLFESGSPVTAMRNLTFRIYDTATVGTGSLLWTGAYTTMVTGGIFQVNLGSPPALPLALPFDKPYWLQISIGTTILSPRVQLTASPYALSLRLPFGSRANEGASAGSDPAFKVSNTGAGHGLQGLSASNAGVWGQSTLGNGVVGVSDTTDGVAGYARSASRSGVFGQNTYVGSGSEFDPPFYGVAGLAGGAAGRGVFGVGGGYGVFGYSADGAGVYGQSVTDIGVNGSSTNAAGVRAENVNTAGTALEIFRGALKVTGAGLNTNTTAFVVSNSGPASTGIIIINNSIINNDPTAMVFITTRWPGGTIPTPRVSVCYACAGAPSAGRWVIVSEADGMWPGLQINVLAIKTQ